VTDTRISICLDDLAATLTRLHALQQHLGTTGCELRRAANVSGLGDVSGGVNGSVRHWQHGLAILHDSVRQLFDTLVVVHSGYAEHEVQLQQLLTGR